MDTEASRIGFRTLPIANRVLFVALTLSALLPGGAVAEPRFRYAAKFICGRSDGDSIRVVAPGIYYTAINVHNPNPEPIALTKNISVALPSEHAGPVTQFVEARLGPDQTFEIDCIDIVRHARGLKIPPPFGPKFLKGFVNVLSDIELDVVAVYTATGATGKMETMEIERVPARAK